MHGAAAEVEEGRYPASGNQHSAAVELAAAGSCRTGHRAAVRVEFEAGAAVVGSWGRPGASGAAASAAWAVGRRPGAAEGRRAAGRAVGTAAARGCW